MRLIDELTLQRELFCRIQGNAIDSGSVHYDSYKKWCLSGSEVEKAISDIFSQVEPFCPTIDSETLPVVRELRAELERVTRERDEIATLCGKLFVICNQPREKQEELFLKYRGSMIGDYMGSGYPFVDAFNRIIDDFMLAMSDGAYKAVMEAAHKEIQSKIKPSEVQKDE